MSFSSDVKKFKESAGNLAEKAFRAKVLGVMTAILKRTPVDTGRLRANWVASVGKPNRQIQDRKRTPNHAELASTLGGAGLGDTMYFTNNLPYAEEMENGRIGPDGSKQAPMGMMRISVLEAGE